MGGMRARKEGIPSTVFKIRMKMPVQEALTRFPYFCTRLQEGSGDFYLVPNALPLGAAAAPAPATFLALLASQAISDLYPRADKPVVCRMAMDMREGLGSPHTFRNCVASLYLPLERDRPKSRKRNSCGATGNWYTSRKPPMRYTGPPTPRWTLPPGGTACRDMRRSRPCSPSSSPCASTPSC